jgi:hypothetical protein
MNPITVQVYRSLSVTDLGTQILQIERQNAQDVRRGRRVSAHSAQVLSTAKSIYRERTVR